MKVKVSEGQTKCNLIMRISSSLFCVWWDRSDRCSVIWRKWNGSERDYNLAESSVWNILFCVECSVLCGRWRWFADDMKVIIVYLSERKIIERKTGSADCFREKTYLWLNTVGVSSKLMFYAQSTSAVISGWSWLDKSENVALCLLVVWHCMPFSVKI